ncbi:MAG TPA: N-methyl-L-tryptophan oxidase, partial [Bryobacteraceae bacterium]|nr:N-methyl-L-tryptophan oxidase [Bryobacteraceae bacterium]
MRTADVAIIGLGTMGSFTCLELARRGLRVAGFDRFEPPHGRGSHSGDTRVFRTAYAEHPDYVPLALRAGELWDQYGSEFGHTLLTRSGMLSMGPPDGDLVTGIRRSAQMHHLQVEELRPDEIRGRYPGFSPPGDYVGLFEASAGWVDVNRAIAGAFTGAKQRGAALFPNTAVAAWRASGSTIELETTSGRFEASHLVITAGAWAGSVLRDLGLPLSVRRKVLVWVDPLNADHFTPGRFPVFAVADRFFYGFPNIGGEGVKLAIHWEHGDLLADPSEPVAAPGEADIVPVLEMASQYLNGLAAPAPDGLARVPRSAVCLYTMTPD